MTARRRLPFVRRAAARRAEELAEVRGTDWPAVLATAAGRRFEDVRRDAIDAPPDAQRADLVLDVTRCAGCGVALRDRDAVVALAGRPLCHDCAKPLAAERDA